MSARSTPWTSSAAGVATGVPCATVVNTAPSCDTSNVRATRMARTEPRFVMNWTSSNDWSPRTEPTRPDEDTAPGEATTGVVVTHDLNK
jgi:hypothetical protein